MGHEKGRPPKGPAFVMLARFRAYLLPYYRTTVLPNDPASQQATGQEQGARTDREYWSTTRGRERGGSSRSGSGGVNVHVAASSDAAEARAHLVLLDAQILRDTGEVLLVPDVVLAGRSGLDLVAVHVLDAATHGVGLGESRGGGGHDHGQQCHQQCYFPQLHTSLPKSLP